MSVVFIIMGLLRIGILFILFGCQVDFTAEKSKESSDVGGI